MKNSFPVARPFSNPISRNFVKSWKCFLRRTRPRLSPPQSLLYLLYLLKNLENIPIQFFYFSAFRYFFNKTSDILHCASRGFARIWSMKNGLCRASQNPVSVPFWCCSVMSTVTREGQGSRESNIIQRGELLETRFLRSIAVNNWNPLGSLPQVAFHLRCVARNLGQSWESLGSPRWRLAS